MAIGSENCSTLTRELERIHPMLGIKGIKDASNSIFHIIACMDTRKLRDRYHLNDFPVPIAVSQFNFKRIGDLADLVPTTQKDAGSVSGVLYITSRRMRSYTTTGEIKVCRKLEIFANVNVGGCTCTSGELSMILYLRNDVDPLKQFVSFATTDRSIKVITHMILDAYAGACEKVTERVALRHLDYIK